MRLCAALWLLASASAVVALDGGYCKGKTYLEGSLCDFTSASKCTRYSTFFGARHPCAWVSQPFASDTYQALSASSKMSRLWSAITKNNSPGPWFSKASVIANVLKEDLKTTFSFKSDQLPKGHSKIIHSRSSNAQVQWINAGGHSYTGLFKGATQGIIRLSAAAQPDYSQAMGKGDPTKPGVFKPGFALKLLRDGRPSGNFVAMPQLGAGGQNSWNFFRQSFFNHVAAPDNAVLQDKFATASGWVNMVGLKDFASTGADGRREATPKFPFILRFQPTKGVSNLFPDKYSGTHFRDQLNTLKAGTVLYDVYAKSSPKSTEQKIASLKITTRPVNSQFSDTTLFFQHGKMEDDISMNKAWLKETSQRAVSSKVFTHLIETASETQLSQLQGACPFSSTMLAQQAGSAPSTALAAKDAQIAALTQQLNELRASSPQSQLNSSAGGSSFLSSALVGVAVAAIVGAVAVVLAAVIRRSEHRNHFTTYSSVPSTMNVEA